VKFEWDPEKAALNLQSHGVSFEDAASVFGDPLATTIPDPDHSTDELRSITMGMTPSRRLLVVVSTDRADWIRIISARPESNRRIMKKAKTVVADDDMRPEYDFSGGVRGKYYERFHQNSNVVLLDPDVSAAFPNSASVNQALRVLASAARKTKRVMRRPSSPQRRPNKRMQLTRSAKAKRRGPRS
jgi:uncharacterized DUF497 family protein